MEAFEYNIEFLRKQSGLNYQKFCQVIGFSSKSQYKSVLKMGIMHNDPRLRRICILFGVKLVSIFRKIEYYNSNHLIDMSELKVRDIHKIILDNFYDNIF